ncbi:MULTISPECIES: hypothetical protein [unclassified Prochlorococcus]|uniref:hypothetical protein n=1 Tax=unclassified Prochlorococcus TaxID=2627481 RepID=UPI00126986F6|nr:MULTISPECIES: hypothetical protein [unclassified Prochlorococcus]
MSEKRFSILFILFSQILVLRYLLSLYFNGSLFWIPVGISFVLVLMILITDDKSIYRLTSNFSLNRQIQISAYLVLCFIYIFACLAGLILLTKLIPINDYSITLVPFIALYICVFGSIVGITHKLFSAMRNNAKY